MEIILNFLAFTCSDSGVTSTTTNLTYCNDTEIIRNDFKHMIDQILRQSALIVKSNSIEFNSTPGLSKTESTQSVFTNKLEI